MYRRDFLKLGAMAGAVTAFSPELLSAALAEGNGRKTLVLGGSAFAIGYAIAHPGEAVVIERGIHLAPEFSQTGDWGALGEAKTAEGREIAERIAGAGLVTDGRLELPPLSDFLHAYAADKGIPLFCSAELVSFRGGCAAVCGGGSSGVCEVDVKSLLDTTPVGWRDCGMKDVASRSFSVVTASGLVSVSLPGAATRRDARLRLWEKTASLPKGEAIAEANEMGTAYSVNGGKTISRQVEKLWRWLPSAQFPTFMAAFEEGVKCSLA